MPSSHFPQPSDTCDPQHQATCGLQPVAVDPQYTTQEMIPDPQQNAQQSTSTLHQQQQPQLVPRETEEGDAAPLCQPHAVVPAEPKTIELRAVTGHTGYRASDGGDSITAFVIAEDLDAGLRPGWIPMSEHERYPLQNPKKHEYGWKVDLNKVAPLMPRNHSLAFIGSWKPSVSGLPRSCRLSNPIEVPVKEFSDSNKKGPYHEGFEHGWRLAFSMDDPNTWPPGLTENGNPWMCEDASFRMMSQCSFMVFPLDANGKQLFEPWLGWQPHELDRTPWHNGVQKGIEMYKVTMKPFKKKCQQVYHEKKGLPCPKRYGWRARRHILDDTSEESSSESGSDSGSDSDSSESVTSRLPYFLPVGHAHEPTTVATGQRGKRRQRGKTGEAPRRSYNSMCKFTAPS